MTEWISVKESLPSNDIFVNVRKSYKCLQKVKLMKVEDKAFFKGYSYEWQYPSGINAGFLDEKDEWMPLILPGKE